MNPDQVIRVPRAQIVPSPLNPRKHFPDEKLNELALNIRELGIINPLLVRPLSEAHSSLRLEQPEALYEIVAGECRWRSSGERSHPERPDEALAALETLPVLVRELSDRETLELMLSENMQRNDLTELEQMAAFLRMLGEVDERGEKVYTAGSLAQKIGVSEGYVKQRVDLQKLPPLGIEALRSGRIPFRTARLISRCPGAVIELVLDEVLNPKKYDSFRYRDIDALDHDQTEELIHSKYVRELRGSPFDQKRADLVPVTLNEAGERTMGGACTDCPWRSQDGKRAVEARCLNPVCYKKKVEVNVAAELVKAQEQNCKVLTDDEASRVMYENGDLRYDTSYVDLDKKPDSSDLDRAAEQKKVPTWGKIVSGETKPEIVVAVDKRGHVHRLVHRKEALAAAKINGNEKFLNLSSGRGNSLDEEDQKAQRKKEIAAQKLRSAQCHAVLSALIEAYEAELSYDMPLGFLRAWTPVAIRHAGSAGCILVAKRHQLERKPAADDALKKYADGLEDWRMLACLHFELMLSEDFAYVDSPHNSEILPRSSKALFELFELSLAEIKSKVAAEFSTAKKEAKSKGKKEPELATPVQEPLAEAAISEELLARARMLSRPWSAQQIAIGIEVDFDVACKVLDALLDEKYAPAIAAEAEAEKEKQAPKKRAHTPRQKKALKAAGIAPDAEESATE